MRDLHETLNIPSMILLPEPVAEWIGRWRRSRLRSDRSWAAPEAVLGGAFGLVDGVPAHHQMIDRRAAPFYAGRALGKRIPSGFVRIILVLAG
jgi:hypothetical protein